MRSVYDAIKCSVSLVPATYTADQNGTGVDTKGYNSAVMLVQAGDIDTASGNETYAVKLQESDDNINFFDVSGYSVSITADNQTEVLRIEGLGTSRKRYLRAFLDVGGTTPSFTGTVIFLLGRAYKEPVN